MDPLHSPASRQWHRIGVHPRHGINLPLFSLRSEKSLGIGEFYDLLPVIDFCQSVGFSVIQLLPLQDSGHDPSPYNALSSCALNPLYLSLHKLPKVKNLPDATYLNQLQRVSYPEVQSLKWDLLATYYQERGRSVLSSFSFKRFVSKNPWLFPYAVFKVIKDRLSQNPWRSWPEELSSANLPQLIKKYEDEIPFYLFLQYLCHEQLSQVKEYASQKNVLLKGDLPILISPDSADAWSSPHLFDFSLAAGAPPDPYNQDGQYWGFPLFRWDEIKKTHFAWWKERLSSAESYYDIYRLDHVVGLFRLWGIPLHASPKEGKFYPENPSLWLPQGEEVLRFLLQNSPLLPIGEDLGQVPPSVRQTLQEMGICTTKVMRWERTYTKHPHLLPYAQYPLLSMTTISTHDSEPLQLFWQNNPEEAELVCKAKKWVYSPDLSFSNRFELLKDSHHTNSLFHINLLQEYLALFPDLIWNTPEEEQINIPGTVSPTNWTYRFRPLVEEWTSHNKLQECMIQLIKG